MLSGLPVQAIDSVLMRLGEVCRQTRLGLNHTQAEQAELAEISLRAAQNIESGQSGQTAILLKYLFSLGLQADLLAAFPDPDTLSPLEALAIKEKTQNRRPQRASKSKRSIESKPKWGDEIKPTDKGES